MSGGEPVRSGWNGRPGVHVEPIALNGILLRGRGADAIVGLGLAIGAVGKRAQSCVLRGDRGAGLDGCLRGQFSGVDLGTCRFELPLASQTCDRTFTHAGRDAGELLTRGCRRAVRPQEVPR